MMRMMSEKKTRALAVARTCAIILTALGAACSSTGPAGDDIWGSDLASLIVNSDAAVLQIRADGGCYGSYADITLPEPIPSGSFQLTGTYTQLTGAYPGKVSYDAGFTGSRGARDMTMTVTVPALAASFGPYHLTRHVNTRWPACLYP